MPLSDYPPLLTSKPATMTQSAQTTIPPNPYKVLVTGAVAIIL